VPLELDRPVFLALLRAGDERAFSDLITHTAPRLLVVARRMLADEHNAQDGVQEAYLAAFKSLPRFDGRSALTTWLHRIAINACLMKLRHRRRHPTLPVHSVEDLQPQFADDGHQRTPCRPWQPDPASGIQREETHALIHAAIDQLPDTYREIILLRDLAELDTLETAEVLGLSLSAVKTRLQRARHALRALLEPHFTATGS
jgi:RNA polymerase sigma-70 factor (ECF subfamily)